MTYQCEVTEQPAQSTLSVRTKTSVENLPQVLGKIYCDIAQYLEEAGEHPAGPPFTAYYNMDMQNLDIEAGFPVPGKLAGKGDIQPGEIPEGKIATCVHTGPYNEMETAYKAISQWMIEKGYEPLGVAYEMYLNDPEQTPPQELKTQIVFPLK
ncbi:GyrI-like domain-containing protein [Desulfococcaceae bacterium HSG8]|nr:GyrI-like domain-containing protein [Desulfococcaceae bacterium HSG8]